MQLTIHHMISRRALIVALGLQSAIAAQPAMAQARTASEAMSGDIIVTAQRRSERVTDVPISITALSSESLQAASIASANAPTPACTAVISDAR